MDSDFQSPKGITEINLDNYFPNRRSYNTVEYLHRKFLPGKKAEKVKDVKKALKPDKNKCKKIGASCNAKHDKSQQFNSETVNQQTFKYGAVETGSYNNPVLEQTIRFAKNLVPLVIPPLKETSSSPVFYTIKTSRKHKKQEKKHDDIEQDVTYNKDHIKKDLKKKIKKTHKERCNGRESVCLSSQNTLDDFHININQSCSFSESTEVKFHKRDPSYNKISNENSQKFFISNSFEALATESISDGNKIKIHLMNDTDKTLFRESIKNPIINTIRDYLTQWHNNNDLSSDFITVQKVLRMNSKKIDDILEKLSRIEKRLDTHAKHTNRVSISPRVQSAKASRLEELGQDIIKVRQCNASEEDLTEEYNNLPKTRTNRSKSVVVTINPREHAESNENNNDVLGCGEDVPGPLNDTSLSQLGVKPERPNRIPARFCWTDADRKK